MNLAEISDENIIAAENPEAALGLFAMKYAFDAMAFKSRFNLVENLLGRMLGAFLGEFIGDERHAMEKENPALD